MEPTPAHECRLVIDPPHPGAWNMAVDEILARWAARHQSCVWRFYQWSEPTLSLGYFQPLDQRSSHAASDRSACVRRASGGGAILHDRELTYCLAVAERHPLAANAETLYRRVHGTLVDALASFDILAQLSDQQDEAPPAQQPFLCFARRARGDVLVERCKVGGSAQWRGLGAILQHGSVILQRSGAAPEIEGLAELSGRHLTAEQLAAAWQEQITRQLQVTWNIQPLSPFEHSEVEDLIESKYKTPAWNARR